MQEVEQNFRQVVVLQSVSNYDNTSFIDLNLHILFLPFFKVSFEFERRWIWVAADAWDGTDSPHFGEAVLPCGSDGLWAIRKPDPKPDTNETLNGTNEDDEEIHHWNKLFAYFRQRGTRSQYDENPSNVNEHDRKLYVR